MFTFPVGFYQQPATEVDYAARWRSNAIASGGTISTGTYNATHAFVNTLQTAGTLAKLNLLWHFSGDYAASPYLLKYPSGHPGVVVYHGFSSSQYSETTGLLSTGSEYADLQYIPSTYQASNLRGSMIVYRHDSGTMTGDSMGVLVPGGSLFDITPRFGDNNAYFSCHSVSGRIITSCTDGSGLFIGNRNADNYMELTRNGSLLASTATPGTNSLPTTTMLAFALNYNDGSTLGIFGAVQRLSLIAIGEGLSSDDVGTINSAYPIYAAAIGRSLP